MLVEFEFVANSYLVVVFMRCHRKYRTIHRAPQVAGARLPLTRCKLNASCKLRYRFGRSISRGGRLWVWIRFPVRRHWTYGQGSWLGLIHNCGRLGSCIVSLFINQGYPADYIRKRCLKPHHQPLERASWTNFGTAEWDRGKNVCP